MEERLVLLALQSKVHGSGIKFFLYRRMSILVSHRLDGPNSLQSKPLASTGGIQVEGLGATDIDGQSEFQNSPSVGDIGLELHLRISAVYGRSERLETVLKDGIKDLSVWRFEARVAESVIKDWLGEFQNIQIIKV